VTVLAMPSRNARAGAERPSPEVLVRKARLGTAHSAPKGRPGSEDPAPGRVAEIQRQRILGAMAEVAAERGAANVTVAHVVARAGISRRTFYELFEDREACLLAALDDAVGRAAAVVLPAYEHGGRSPGGTGPRAGAGWRERIRAGLAALLQFLEEEPGLGRLCVVEALGAGERALERRALCVSRLIEAVDGGRGVNGASSKSAGRQPPPLTAEGVVGAVFSIVHARVLAQGSRGVEPMTELLGPLMAVIVLPYLGMRAAEQELRKPAPPLKTKARPRRDPLEGLDMRLTYRTVRVLIAIAGHPGASNRLVAEGSGISDQGQISKLLARLDSLGLVQNTGQGHPRGAPNAWQLTPRGDEVEQAIRLQTTSP
jgi:AcrR family transcriptional regulator